MEIGDGSKINNCRNAGEITSKKSVCGGIAGTSSKVTNSCNTGKVTAGSGSTAGYFLGVGTNADDTNRYLKQIPDIKKDNAKEFESEKEKNKLMDVKSFVNKMNGFDPWTEIDYDAYITLWIVEDGLPIFDNSEYN